MSQRLLSRTLLAATLGAALATNAHAGLINGSFESLSVPFGNNGFIITDAANLPGWKTTAADNMVEVWSSPGTFFLSAYAVHGNRFTELNANMIGTLYQDATGIGAGLSVGWQLSHRGRTGPDTMRLTLTDLGSDGSFGTGDDTVLFTRTFTTGLTWANYAGTGVTALGNTVRFAFESVSTFDGNQGAGNWLDATAFGVGVVPEPGTWAMMLAGLFATAGIARRTRRV